MTKKIAKSKNIKIIQKYTIKDVEEHISNIALKAIGIDPALEQYAKKYMGKYDRLDIKKINMAAAEFTSLSFALGIENGHIIAFCVDEVFKKSAVQMKRKLEKEFNCTSYSERALVDLAVNAYMRAMKHSRDMNNNHIDQKNDSYRHYLSREIDRAYRQYISTIEALKFMKQPALKVNIRTNSAFIGENQQFNTNQNQKNENNEAK